MFWHFLHMPSRVNSNLFHASSACRLNSRPGRKNGSASAYLACPAAFSSLLLAARLHSAAVP